MARMAPKRTFSLLPVASIIGALVIVTSLPQMLSSPRGLASVWDYWMWQSTASSSSSSDDGAEQSSSQESSEQSDPDDTGSSSSGGNCPDPAGTERDWLTTRITELSGQCGTMPYWGMISVTRACDRSDQCGENMECATFTPASGMDSEPVCVGSSSNGDLEAQVAQFVDVPCAPDRIRVRVKVRNSNPAEYVSICIKYANTTPNKELALSGNRIVVRELDRNGKPFYVNIGPEGKATTIDNNTDGLKFSVGPGGELRIDLQDQGEGVKPQYLKVVKGADGYYKIESRPAP